MTRWLLRLALVSLCGLAALLPLGCGSGGDFDLAQSAKGRNRSPNPPAADVTAQVVGNTQLALDVYRHLAKEGSGNLFFSPHSISTALAMTWAGARGTTEQEMATTMHFVLPQERLHPVFNDLDLKLESRARDGKGSDGKGFRLRVVNSTWTQRGFPILASFLDVLAESYGSAVRLVDFAADAEGARRAINGWVEDETEDRIKDLLPQGAIGPITRLVLVNAVYFNASWAEQFKKESTRNETFYRLDDSGVTVPMMHQQETLRYGAASGWQAVELAYEGNELAMLIVVPDHTRFVEIERTLNADHVSGIVGALENRSVALGLPRWTLKGASFSLKRVLSDLGMPMAFTADADLSGIDGRPDLFIDDVLHQAFVKVDEAGTEAAAATAVPISPTSAPVGPVVLTVDRPFIYFIRDRPTGAVLFIGRVTDPSVS
jgi:serpin B